MSDINVETTTITKVQISTGIAAEYWWKSEPMDEKDYFDLCHIAAALLSDPTTSVAGRAVAAYYHMLFPEDRGIPPTEWHSVATKLAQSVRRGK